jgi:hypothetical protein
MLVCDVAEVRCFRLYRGREGPVAMGDHDHGMGHRSTIAQRVCWIPGRRAVGRGADSAGSYRSSNGDRWTLIRDSTAGRLFVRHEANSSSGGQATDTDVDTFLSVAGSGQEFAALRRLLGKSTEPTTAS